jgi:very-short-patch-repair endonuclease
MSKDRARHMRHNATGPERKVWRLLQELKPLGYHFRRQVPIGRYYADFACHHANLIVEVDGETHGSDIARAYDAVRDEFLHDRGYDVMRLSNDDVLHNWDGVLMAFEQVLEGRPKSPGFDTPTSISSPQGGGGPVVDGRNSESDDAPASPSPPCGERLGVGVGQEHEPNEHNPDQPRKAE